MSSLFQRTGSKLISIARLTQGLSFRPASATARDSSFRDIIAQEREEDEVVIDAVRHAMDVLLQEYKAHDIYSLFSSMDRADQGTLSKEDLMHGLAKLGVELRTAEASQLFLVFDDDDSGRVDYSELVRVIVAHEHDAINYAALVSGRKGDKVKVHTLGVMKSQRRRAAHLSASIVPTDSSPAPPKSPKSPLRRSRAVELHARPHWLHRQATMPKVPQSAASQTQWMLSSH